LPAWDGLVSKPNDCFMAWENLTLIYSKNMTPGKTIKFLAEESSDFNDYNFIVKQYNGNEIKSWNGHVCFFTRAALQKTVQKNTRLGVNAKKARLQI
jgi:hypothetical protein